MDQQRIGAFIAELRKEKVYTQAELGEKLGVTNKTVSRWENGNYMPDLSVLPILCGELGISINELLSGKRLDNSEFRSQADVNLLCTMENREYIFKQKRWGERFLACGIGALFSTASSPETWRKTAVLGFSVLLIVVGWYLRRKVDVACGINF